MMAQVICMVAGAKCKIWGSTRSRNEFIFDNTPAQYIEIKAAFDFYWTLYEAELKLFTTAFIYKNEMLPSDAGTSLDSLSEEEASRILQLMNGIQKKTMLKRLETSK